MLTIRSTGGLSLGVQLVMLFIDSPVVRNVFFSHGGEFELVQVILNLEKREAFEGNVKRHNTKIHCTYDQAEVRSNTAPIHYRP